MKLKDLPLFLAPDVAETGLLPESEAQHCSRVLRAEVGDEILVTDGRGAMYEATISHIDKRSCAVLLGTRLDHPKSWRGSITLAIAPTKSIDRIEWLLEKVSEIGIDRIILLRVKHSERKQVNAERLERILQSAMKQSQKSMLPELLVDKTLDEALELTQGGLQLLAHCRDSEMLEPRRAIHELYKTASDVALFIGPEGDFTVEEVMRASALGAHGLSLGEARLRTETAGLVAVHSVHLLQQTGIV